MSPAPQPTTTGQARSTSQVPRVLIVEDELLVAWHLESLAREQNLEVCGLVPDGDGAIEQAIDLDVDLILMDIRLAGRMDGIEAARRIREQRDTPIIFITAHGDPATRAQIEQVLPGTPVLAKPITADRLQRGDRLGDEDPNRLTPPRSAPARRCR